MTLQAKLDAFKADFKGGKAPYFAPPEIHPVMERATAELVASGQAGRALKASRSARTSWTSRSSATPITTWQPHSVCASHCRTT
jgi:hypothetical protein